MFDKVAVAAPRPEILVVDDVLAVGDAEFQKKCLSKMGTASVEGRTVLFVSHNMSAVQDLCRTAFWLDRGRVVFSGDTRTTVAAYLSKHAREIKEHRWDDLRTAPGNETVRVVYAAVEAEPSTPTLDGETPLRRPRFINYRPTSAYLNFQSTITTACAFQHHLRRVSNTPVEVEGTQYSRNF
jgi:lipopolysaccharide transport system ATP-binding protein